MKTRSILFLAFTMTAWATVAAEEAFASFSEINGKVEFQKPNASWKLAHIGDKVYPCDIVSTGFKSTAILKIGQTTISVKAITRMTLTELVKTSGGTSTTLFLLSGRVKADVPPQPGQTQSFQITSPTATASVRGTAFEFDGVNLIVDRGTVQLQTPTRQFRHVEAGQFSTIAAGGVIPPPAVVNVDHGLSSVHELVVQQQSVSFAPPPVEANMAPPSSTIEQLAISVY